MSESFKTSYFKVISISIINFIKLLLWILRLNIYLFLIKIDMINDIMNHQNFNVKTLILSLLPFLREY